MQITVNSLSWKAFIMWHLVILMCAIKIPHTIALPPLTFTVEAKHDASWTLSQNSHHFMIQTNVDLSNHIIYLHSSAVKF